MNVLKQLIVLALSINCAFATDCVRQKRSFIDSITGTVVDAYRNVKETVENIYTNPNKNDHQAAKIEELQSEIKARTMAYKAKLKRCLENYRKDDSSRQSVKFLMSKYHDAHPFSRISTAQLIAAYGYHSESHTLVTDDMYILTLHRIPFSNKGRRKSPRKTVLLHHGLLGSSADWVIGGPEKALAFFLSDAGYDVWLANARGNTYSRAHVVYTDDNPTFWNYSWHEVSQHDLPAIIDYIMLQKGVNEKINYIGHSMGTTILFALLSTKPQYNSILRAGFALAPVAYMTDIKSPIHYLAKYVKDMQYLLNIMGTNELLSQSDFMRWVIRHTCEIYKYEQVLCENVLFLFCGFDRQQLNPEMIPMILSNVPAGTSVKTIVHYAQEIKNKGRFQEFDYGPEGNMAQYGTLNPPQYNLKKINLPIALFSATNDWLSSPSAVKRLYSELANPIENYVVPNPAFNHIDFLWGKSAPELVYKKLLQLLIALGNSTNHI